MNGMARFPLSSHTALTRWEFSPFAVLVLVSAVAAAVWYLRAQWSLSARGRHWSAKRTAAFLCRVGRHCHRPAVAGGQLHHGVLPGSRHPAPAVNDHRAAPAGHGGTDDPCPPDVESNRQDQALGPAQFASVQGPDPSLAGVVPLLLLDVRLLPDLRHQLRHGTHVAHGPDQSGFPVRFDAVLVAAGRARSRPALADGSRVADGQPADRGSDRGVPGPGPPQRLPSGGVHVHAEFTHSGAAILWVGAELLTFLALIPVFVQWVRSEERKTAREDAQMDAELAASGATTFRVVDQ